jgi:hypothetical protein
MFKIDDPIHETKTKTKLSQLEIATLKNEFI